MPGVVYPPPEKLQHYVDAGALTHETLVDGFRASVSRDPDSPALVGPGGNHSYAELDGLTDRLAGALLRLGMRPLDRVIYQIGNSNELLFFFLACLMCKAMTPGLTMSHLPTRCAPSFPGCNGSCKPEAHQGMAR
jgi:non-ribosomal peptide synthetase component E (peptide arylation enzyme)